MRSYAARPYAIKRVGHTSPGRNSYGPALGR
jgi:hypothetical protein